MSEIEELRDEIARLAAENERLKAELNKTAADVLAVLDGREPETWAWPLHGLRDELNKLRAEKAGLLKEIEELVADAERRERLFNPTFGG